MNKKRILLAIAIIIFITAVQIRAQDFAPVGTAIAQFLEIGIGARGPALGEAYTAVTNDAGSVFWNPAGLATVTGGNFFTAYNRWPADIAIGGFSFALNLANIGTLAISSAYLMTDNMEVTTVYQPEGTGATFGISNYSLGISFARSLTDRLALGLTTKLVHEKYLSYGYDSWALDLGTLYRTGFHGLNLGMSILHFGPEVDFNGSFIDYSDPKSVDVNKPKSFERHSLPINFRVGVSIDLLDSQHNKITTSVDMVHPNNNIEQYNWGLEYSFNQMFFIRGGYKFNSDVGGFAAGTGIHFNLFGDQVSSLDYSFSDMGVLTDVHRASLSFSF